MKSSSECSTTPISVVIADDHPVVRQGLAAIFKSQSDIEVVAEAANGEEALEMCNRHFPDVLLLDLRMPRKDGWQVMTELAARNVGLCRVFANVKNPGNLFISWPGTSLMCFVPMVTSV